MNCIVILCDTLRRDHCGPYQRERPLHQVVSQVVSRRQPPRVVPTPDTDRLAALGSGAVVQGFRPGDRVSASVQVMTPEVAASLICSAPGG